MREREKKREKERGLGLKYMLRFNYLIETLKRSTTLNQIGKVGDLVSNIGFTLSYRHANRKRLKLVIVKATVYSNFNLCRLFYHGP